MVGVSHRKCDNPLVGKQDVETTNRKRALSDRNGPSWSPAKQEKATTTERLKHDAFLASTRVVGVPNAIFVPWLNIGLTPFPVTVLTTLARVTRTARRSVVATPVLPWIDPSSRAAHDDRLRSAAAMHHQVGSFLSLTANALAGKYCLLQCDRSATTLPRL